MRISDLLDGWEDSTYVPPPPQEVSPERIRKRTMEQLHKKPSFKRRAVIRIVLCAALIAVLTVSAVAAYQVWGPGTLLDSFFVQTGEPLDEGQKELLDEMGTTNLAPVVSNGITLTPLTAVGDEHALYLRLRVEAPAGTALPDMVEAEGHVFEGVVLTDAATGEDLNWGMQKARFLPDETPGDNVIELVFILYGTPNSVNWNDGSEKILTLRRLHLEPTDSGQEPMVLDGTWEFRLSHFYQSHTVEADVDGVIWEDTVHQNTLTLDYLQISPLGVTYRITCTDTMQVPMDDVGIDLLLDDGTLLSLGMGNGTIGPDYLESTWTFDAPIPLDRIDSILFGSESLTLPASTS